MLLTLLLILLAPTSFACDAETLPQTSPAPHAGTATPARVAFTLDGNNLRARFDVAATEVNGKPKLGPNEFPYMFDVAEVFVSTSGGVPYYEFEVTPFDQTFQVRIYYAIQPRPGVPPKKAFQNGIDVGLGHKVTRSEKGWKADLDIPLDRIGWQGDPGKITGNAFVILGRGAARRFFSRSLPVQQKPNFHLPEYFRPLLSCPRDAS